MTSAALTPVAPGEPIRPPLDPARKGRALVVSLHDVSPHTFEACREIVGRLEVAGVSPLTLLVIPDHHRKGHFLDDPAFCHWLKEREAKGDELVIHGFYHQRVPRAGESLRERFLTRTYTAGEGEFFDISGSEALRLVSDAREAFRKLGFQPRGFIAPAWLLSQAAERALRKLGFAYTVRLREVIDLPCERRHAAPSLVWSVRSWWRRVASRVWNRRLYRKSVRKPLLRIGIHPVDLQHRAVWAQVEALTRQAAAERELFSYARWIEQTRTS